MTERIHPAWLQPMPSYYQDWAYRDDPRLIVEYIPLASATREGERECEFCGAVFEPKNAQAGHRICCYEPECEKARKRRNARLSARRVAERKRLQA